MGLFSRSYSLRWSSAAYFSTKPGTKARGNANCSSSCCRRTKACVYLQVYCDFTWWVRTSRRWLAKSLALSFRFVTDVDLQLGTVGWRSATQTNRGSYTCIYIYVLLRRLALTLMGRQAMDSGVAPTVITGCTKARGANLHTYTKRVRGATASYDNDTL